MRLRAFDILGILAVTSWIGWIAFSALTEGGGLEDVERLEISDQERKDGWRDGVEWQGIYLKDQKVGYIKIKKWREAGDQGEVHLIDSDMILHLTVMRTRQKIKTKTLARLSPDMTLESFDLQITSGPADMRMTGTVEGNTVTMRIDSGGGVQTETITLKEPPKLSLSLKPLLMREGLKAGDKLSTRFFDPASLTERELVITYKGPEKINIMDQEVEAHHFVQQMGGIQLDLWTNGIGEVLRENLPMGLVGMREAGVEARYGVIAGTISPAEDVIDAVSVIPHGSPISTAAVDLSLELSGLSFEGLDLDGGRQRWTPADAAQTSGLLHLQVEATAGRPLTLGQLADLDAVAGGDAALIESLRANLKPEMMIQSDDPRILHRAHLASGTSPSALHERQVLEVARDISQWAYEAIAKESVIGVPSALETLETLRGDCNEHTTLVVALLRSVGVPARPAVGIAYLPDRGRFFYHAWVEIWAQGWVAIDPTFGQFPADIGHVRFVNGGLSEQIEMFRVIGQLQIDHPLPAPQSTPPQATP